ncbi:MAG: UDP-glucose/GDP-mannose dehydrogenase family protein [Candidatus Thermoplasmatota archaeon]|nr:UDP-glucose/GDP-mannose dehydrogenase family protein [Candidatus Thermoplasmatota archaeon]
MNISVIGAGYVGLVNAACFAKLGHQVICVDVDKEKVDKINQSISPIYEKDLEEIIKKYKKNIYATTSYKEAVEKSDITFICVGTPSKKNGDIDLLFVDQATKEIAIYLKNKKSFHSVVVKSTVVPGTTQNHVLPLLEEITQKKAGVDFGVGMNPEFLREGAAVYDFLHPDRIVYGYYDDHTKKLLSLLYSDFSCPIVETSLTVAEMIKYASNCFLATKISFINEIGNLCKRLGIDSYEVAEGIGLDDRIGRAFLDSGIGWGGSCFGKDVNALIAFAKEIKEPCNIIQSVVQVNEQQPLRLISVLKKHIPLLKGKIIGVLGLSFKPNTDDIRDSRSIILVKNLFEENAQVKVYDPKAMNHFKKLFSDIIYCDNAKDVLDADAVIIATAWDEFKKLDYKGKIVIDGRRLLEAKKTAKIYEGVCW